jgi:hypothetical protein
VPPVPPPPLAYNTATQFNTMSDNCATDVARQNLEQQAMGRGSNVQEVQLAAMVKYNLRLQNVVTNLAGQVAGAQAAAATANVMAANVPRLWPRRQGMRIVFVLLLLPSIGQEEGREHQVVDSRYRGLSAYRPRCGLYPAGILLSGGWSEVLVDQCLRGV